MPGQRARALDGLVADGLVDALSGGTYALPGLPGNDLTGPANRAFRPGEWPVPDAHCAGYGEALVTGPANRASGPVSGWCAGEVPQRGA